MNRRRNATLFLACLALLLVPVQGFGQAVYGSIFGSVTDSTGAAVPGAKVTVTSVQQGTKSEATTNETGNYSVIHLIPGNYDIRFESQGFKVQETKGVRVFADAAARVDGSFQVGQATETVEVTSAAPELKTDRADVATIFTEKTVKELPIFNRNFTELQLLTPGTQRFGWTHASSENPQGSVQLVNSGQPFSGTGFQLDGTDNQDPILGIIVINPTLESVTETKITTQNFDAEFGIATAGLVTAQTKSGTNSFHGSAFWFRRSDELQARNPFTQANPNALTGKFIPDNLWNQFGGSVGGPVIKDKLFFFGDYQGTRRKTGNSVRTTLPTQLVHDTCIAPGAGVVNCDLSQYLAFYGPAAQIYDPLTGNPDGTGRTPFVGNLIPIGRISPQAQALLAGVPLPATGAIEDNYTAGGTGGFDDNAFNIRGDWQASQNLHVFGRYSHARFQLSGPPIFADFGGFGFGEGGFAGTSKTRNHSLALGFDYALSTTLLTDFRFGYLKYNVNVDPLGVGTTPATDFGMPGLNLGDDFTSGMPAFFIDEAGRKLFEYGSDQRGLGFGLGVNRCNCPLRQNERQWQFTNNWTLLQGNHSFKVGADIRFARNLRVPSDAHRAGELTFHEGRTGLATASGFDGGLALGTMLLGEVTRFRRYFSDRTDAEEAQKRWFFYGQDTWRVTPKLTLNYGLRWEIYFPQSVNEDGNGGWLDINTGDLRVGGIGDINRQGNIDNSYTNFAPRLGAAYQITEKTVIRAGYGRSFSMGVFGSVFGHAVTQNLPVLAVQDLNVTSSTASLFNLATGPALPPTPAVGSNGLLPLPNGVFARSLPLKMQLPTLDSWNVTLQHQITTSMFGEIAYVGNKGTHVFAGSGPAYNINQQAVGLGSADSRRPYFNGILYGHPFGWTQNIDHFGNAASSNYHSLQTKLQQRFSGGLSFLAHYTWSKAFNFDADYYAIDPSVNYGRVDFNRDHVLGFNAVWELPFGRGASRAVELLIGGWQINALGTWSSGLPWTPAYQDCGSDRDTGPCRPNLIGSFDPEVGDFDPLTQRVPFFTSQPLGTGAFGDPASLTFGNVGRNTMNGPSFFNTDLSVFKNFKITEQFRAQFRTEIFNIFNHTNLGNPNNCVDCGGNSGFITGTAVGYMPRQVQFGLKIEF
jgi:outer membrane receptor protein involved in Fe transport